MRKQHSSSRVVHQTLVVGLQMLLWRSAYLSKNLLMVKITSMFLALSIMTRQICGVLLKTHMVPVDLMPEICCSSCIHLGSSRNCHKKLKFETVPQNAHFIKSYSVLLSTCFIVHILCVKAFLLVFNHFQQLVQYFR